MKPQPSRRDANRRWGFRRLCAGPFQPERGSPLVAVYDRFEAPGIEFDGLWVAGLSAANLPRAPVPDPLLPVSLQRALGIPGATPEDCRAEAEALVQAWCGTGAEVVLSWPAHQDDARVEGSRLVQVDAPLAAPPASPSQVTRTYGRRAQCQAMPATQPAPLAPAAARGTSRLFELQAQCPFHLIGPAAGRSGQPADPPSAQHDCVEHSQIEQHD